MAAAAIMAAAPTSANDRGSIFTPQGYVLARTAPGAGVARRGQVIAGTAEVSPW